MCGLQVVPVEGVASEDEWDLVVHGVGAWQPAQCAYVGLGEDLGSNASPGSAYPPPPPTPVVCHGCPRWCVGGAPGLLRAGPRVFAPGDQGLDPGQWPDDGVADQEDGEGAEDSKDD